MIAWKFMYVILKTETENKNMISSEKLYAFLNLLGIRKFVYMQFVLVGQGFDVQGVKQIKKTEIGKRV